MSIHIRVYPQYSNSPVLRARRRAQQIHRQQVNALRAYRAEVRRQQELARFQSMGGLGSAWGGAYLPYTNAGSFGSYGGYGNYAGYGSSYANSGYGGYANTGYGSAWSGVGNCSPVQQSPYGISAWGGSGRGFGW